MNDHNYTQQLNALLSSYQLHYQNLRSLHWNIRGTHFFELHLKYEELYTRTQIIIDELAERILSLGMVPLSSFSEYLSTSFISEIPLIHDGPDGMGYVIKAQKQLLDHELKLLRTSNELEDEGTSSLLSDLIREKEKSTWMFTAWMG